MQLFRTILCPVDFSDYSFLALQYAAAITRENQAKLILFHSIPDLTPARSYVEGNYISTVNDLLTSNAAERLEKCVSEIHAEDLQITSRVGMGSPMESILQIADEEQVDLIVMGTHGFTGQDPFLVGSVTNKILHKSVVPVLVVCKTNRHFVRENGTSRIEVHRILCPLDFEPHNETIRDLALSFGKLYGSEVIFFHVSSRIETVDPHSGAEKAELRLKELVSQNHDESCVVRFAVSNGNPADEILKAIQTMEIDLVVMGHHTRKRIEEIFLGSVAKRIVSDGLCPVVVVRTRSSFTS